MNRRNALRNTGLLVGAAAWTPSLLTLLQSCRSEPRLGWQPQFLSEDEARFLGAFVDTLLPATDTPGGLDVKVDIFLDRVFAQTYNAEAQQQIREEMAAFNADVARQFGAPFAELDATDRAAAFNASETKSAKFNGQVWGTAAGEQAPVGFYRSLKLMVLGAYLSSEEIGAKVLRYDPVPGTYEGCVPLGPGEKMWSL